MPKANIGLAKHLNFITGLCSADNNTTMVYDKKKKKKELCRGNGALLVVEIFTEITSIHI